MSSKKELLDYICDVLKVKYGEEFMIGDIAFKIEKYRLMRKGYFGYQQENFEKILRVVVDNV